jgi:MFS family permease
MLKGEPPVEARLSRAPSEPKLWVIITASTLGTALEGYDYFCFATLSVILSRQFFSGQDQGAAFLQTLLTFGAGFISRPLGAAVFGRLGDRHGRKGTFMATIALMGAATAAIGLLPSYAAVGGLASALLVACRLTQGLALGGEFGGAVIYVAEHSSARNRGFATSWIQTTGAIGLISALGVVLAIRTIMGETAFAAWGWRLPFLASAIPLLASLWMRSRLNESPVFAAMRESHATAQRPLLEVIMQGRILRSMVVVLFGLVVVSGVTFYAGQVYAEIFLERVAKVEPSIVNGLILIASIIGAPLTVMFGAISDRVGRKPILLLGMIIMLLGSYPAYKVMLSAANPALSSAQALHPVVVVAAERDCWSGAGVWGGSTPPTACRLAKQALIDDGIDFRIQDDAMAKGAIIRIGSQASMSSFDGRRLTTRGLAERNAAFRAALAADLKKAGFPTHADPRSIDGGAIILSLLVLITACAALSGPTGAALSEIFPARVRYTALSLPYHIGLGWFGGFMPAIGFATLTATGDIYSGLWYPLGVTLVGFIIAVLFFPETLARKMVPPRRDETNDVQPPKRGQIPHPAVDPDMDRDPHCRCP